MRYLSFELSWGAEGEVLLEAMAAAQDAAGCAAIETEVQAVLAWAQAQGGESAPLEEGGLWLAEVLHSEEPGTSAQSTWHSTTLSLACTAEFAQALLQVFDPEQAQLG